MSNIGKSFRQILRFSKLKKITSQPRSYNTTPVIKDLYGKDLYSPKYGTSYYEAQDYGNNFFHTPQCMPYLKESLNQYYDKEHANDEKSKEKNNFDCENESWTENNQRED